MVHPAGRFDGLRLVPDPDETPVYDEQRRALIAAKLRETAELLRVNGLTVSDPAAFMLVVVGDDSAMVTWLGETDDILDCTVIGMGAPRVVARGRNILEWCDGERQRRVAYRARAAEEKAAYEIEHPWPCECGKRCKTERGLDTHRRSHRIQT